jgi:ribose-phosphate pyrophosphokinase
MELFLMCHTAQKSSARRVTAVIPYIYGCRQDRKTESRTPITIQLIGSLLQASGVKRVLTVSLHNQATVAAFGNVLVDNVSSSFIFAPILKEIYEEEKFFVLSPDAGGVLRAKAYANRFGADLGFVYKIRPEDNKCDTLAFIGDVKDRNVVIIDDIVDTGGTHIKCALAAKDRGAKRITLVVTHPVLSANKKTGVSAIEALQNSPIDKIITSDSIFHENLPSNFEVVSLGSLIGDTICRITSDESVGALWEKESE